MEPNRVLALAVASGRIGVVFVAGKRLLDWRISNLAARSPKAAANYVRKLIMFLRPDVVVTERVDQALHKGDKTKAITLAMAEEATFHDVLDVAVERKCNFANKYEEADALVLSYPDLAPWKPKKRRFFDNEPRNTVLFEALALVELLRNEAKT